MTVTVTPIGVGTVEGDDTGDKARVGAQSINANEANFKAAIEELQGRFWTLQNSTLNPLVIGARYMANSHAGITYTTPASFTLSSTALSDIWITNADDASDITLTPASGDAFFVDGATHGVDTTYAVTPGNLVILSPRTTDSEWDLIVVGSGGGGGAFSADAQTQITPSTSIVLDEATGNEIGLDLQYTVNKATSGNDTGLLINQTDTASPGTSLLADFQVGGVNKFYVDNTGLIRGRGLRVDANGRIEAANGGSRLTIGVAESGTQLSITAAGTTVGSAAGLLISDNAAPQIGTGTGFYLDSLDVLAQRRSTNAQTYNIYNTYTDASNYERLAINGDGSITVETAGTGTDNTDLTLTPAGTGDVAIAAGFKIAADRTTEDAAFINFQATADADATSAISTLTTSGGTTHHIQVEINGTTAWIACSTTDPT